MNHLFRAEKASPGRVGGVNHSWQDVEPDCKSMLVAMGFDVECDGLRDTPARMAKAYGEMLGGYLVDPAEILAREFDLEQPGQSTYSGMVALRGIEFASLCEHHVLPFHGVAHVAYIPNAGRVVGISKLARLVDCFARRLQVQERLTVQIADAIEFHLKARGVAVSIEAEHFCMRMRGVRTCGSSMATSEFRGALAKSKRKAEFMAMLK